MFARSTLNMCSATVRNIQPTSSAIKSPGLWRRPTLPFDLHSKAGFLIPTELKLSPIPGAGLGRFTTVPVSKGWVVRADPIVSVSKFVQAGGVNPEMTVAVDVQSESDIDELALAWTQGASDTERAKIKEYISWFLASVPEHRTDLSTGFSYILGHSFHTNHGCPANIETVVDKGMLFHKAVCDVDAGTELLLDYTQEQVQPFIKSWCDQNGLVDVGTLADMIEQR